MLRKYFVEFFICTSFRTFTTTRTRGIMNIQYFYAKNYNKQQPRHGKYIILKRQLETLAYSCRNKYFERRVKLVGPVGLPLELCFDGDLGPEIFIATPPKFEVLDRFITALINCLKIDNKRRCLVSFPPLQLMK